MSDRLFRERLSDTEDSMIANRGSPTLLSQYGRQASPHPDHRPSRSPRPSSRSPRPRDRSVDLHEAHLSGTPPSSKRSLPNNASTEDTAEFSPWPPSVFSVPVSSSGDIQSALRNAVNTATCDINDSSHSHSPLSRSRSGRHLFAADAVMPSADHLDRSLGFGRFYRAGPDNSESELKQKIQALEDTVAEYERQKTNVMGTFAEYRERVAERERKLEAEYSAKIISLSEDVLHAKKDFEARMKQFATLQERFQSEKDQSLEKLRAEHQKEIEMLEQRMSQSQLLNLERKYMLEIQRLEEERKALRNEKERVGETFESKLRRAQSLYETELSAAKALYSKELEALKEHEAALKEELKARQEDFRERLDDLQHQYQKSKEDLSLCRQEVAELEARLTQKQAQVQQISVELHGCRNENDEALRRLREMSNSLDESKVKQCETEEMLVQKSSMLSVLECAKNKLEAVITDLQLEVKSLKDKVCFLETERQNLESQSETQANLNISQVQALEAVLETVTKEKEMTKEAYEKRLEQERVAADEREFTIRRELGRKLDETEQALVEMKERFDEKLSDERDKIRQKLDSDYSNELNSLKTENESLDEEMQRLRSKLHSLLQQGGVKGQQPTGLGLNVAAASVAPASEHIHKLKRELESKDKALDNSKEQCTQLTAKATNLKRTLEDAEKELNRRQNLIEELTSRITNPSCESSTGAGDTFVHPDQHKIVDLERTIGQLKDKLSKKSSDESNLKAALCDRDSKIAKLDAHIETMRKEVERELRSQFSEAAAENHVADVEAFEKQLQMQKEESDNKVAEKQKEIQKLKEDLKAKDIAVISLKADVNTLTTDLREMKQEIEKKYAELRVFSKEADEYMRTKEDQRQEAHRKKIAEMKAEFDKTLHQTRAREEKLMNEVELFKMTYKDKTGEELVIKESCDDNEDDQLEEENGGASTEATEAAIDSSSSSSAWSVPPLPVLVVPMADDNDNQPQMTSLAQLLAHKDDEINKLKDLVRQAQSNDANLMTRSPESRHRKLSGPDGRGGKEVGQFIPRHQQQTMESLQRRGSTGEGRLCQRAINMTVMNKWHSLVDQVTADNGKARRELGAGRTRSTSAINPKSRPQSDDTADTASDGQRGALSHRDVQLIAANSQRDANSPGRQSNGSKKTPSEKRPAWKF